MKKLCFLFCFLICSSAFGATHADTTFNYNHTIWHIWTSENCKLLSITGKEINGDLLWMFDAGQNRLITYNCRFRGLCEDDRAADSISIHHGKRFGHERANFLGNYRIDDTVTMFIGEHYGRNGYSETAHVQDDGANMMVFERNREPNSKISIYRQLYNGKLVVRAWIKYSRLGLWVYLPYRYKNKFDITISTPGRWFETRQISLLYHLLPALVLLLVYLLIGRSLSKNGEYKRYYVFTTVLVLIFPFILLAFRLAEILLWLYYGLWTIAVVLSLRNLVKPVSKGISIWSAIYLVILMLFTWLIYEITHTSWKIGG